MAEKSKNDGEFCSKCAFNDCLRGGCCGQCVLPADLATMHIGDLTFETMLQHIKRIGKTPEDAYVNIEPCDNFKSPAWKELYGVWQAMVDDISK